MGGSSSKQDSRSRVTMSMETEDTTTDYHKNGTRIERKTVTTSTISAPDVKSFNKTRMAEEKNLQLALKIKT